MRLREIGHADLRGIHLRGRAHRRHDRDAAPEALGDEMAFGLQVVDGVDDEVDGALEDALAGLGRVELGQGDDLGARAHEAQTLLHHVHLALADRALHRVQLAVGVGDADLVEVDEGELTHAASRQRFRGERSHAAHAHDHDVTRHEPVQSRLAEEASRAIEAAVRAVGCVLLGLECRLERGTRRYLGREMGREVWRDLGIARV